MMRNEKSPFADRAAVASYGQETLRRVPGMADLHRMVALLLAEQAPEAAHILVIGAGGGLELGTMAEAQPGWRFEGVDPSSAMLDLAREAVAPVAERVTLVAGTVDQASSGPFDGATCLLVLHFLDREERLHTLREIRRRLRPGGRLVIAHHAPPDGEAERWLTRSAVFADRSGSDISRAAASGRTMVERLALLPPSEEETLLRDAGFYDIALFYAALSFRGWVASAG